MKLTALLLFSLALAGCSGVMLAQNYDNLSADQISALKDLGQDVIACTTVGGPPLGGRSMFVVVPADAKGSVILTPDCQMKETAIQLR